MSIEEDSAERTERQHNLELALRLDRIARKTLASLQPEIITSRVWKDHASYEVYVPLLYSPPTESEAEWKANAACRDLDNIMVGSAKNPTKEPEDGKPYNPSSREQLALMICDVCGVFEQCLDYTINSARTIDLGVLAGQTDLERRRMRKESNKPEDKLADADKKSA